METDLAPPACAPNAPPLRERPLLTPEQASHLERTFKMLANATRLRMLHALARAGELSVSALAETLGMKPTAVSNQLQRLTYTGVVASRRDGVQIHYRLLDPCTASLLDYAWCFTECAPAGGG